MSKIFLLIVFISTSLPSLAETVTAPALISSKASQIRKAREEAEVATESVILERIESQRLRDEKRRIELLKGSSVSSKAVVKPSPSLESSALSQGLWRFGEKAFMFLGIGTVQYPGVKNISSVGVPALFLGFGGYASGNVIVDFVLFQSQHFIEVGKATHPLEGVYQPGAGMALRYSPFEGRVKPYIGASGIYKMSRWFRANRDGTRIGKHFINVGQKTWFQAFDSGVATGVDVALGNRVGVNVDLRYHWNIYTEVNKSGNLYAEQPLDERDSLAFSINLRFYFH